ncbi:MAG: glutamine synthetase, partial [Anaerolineaceae bacterium]|nr:glutamine synthetase [Anaerolineaceae bacterium]
MMSNEVPKLRSLDQAKKLAYGKHNNGSGINPGNVEHCITPEDVLIYAKDRDLMIVDYKFTDLFGRWHHFSMPIHYLDEAIFEKGL